MRQIVVFILYVFSLAAAAESHLVASPDKRLSTTISLENGILSYSVQYDGQVVINPSQLGFTFADGARFIANNSGVAVNRTSFDQTWEQPWGEARYIRNHYNEMSVTFAGAKDSNETLTVRLRLYNDGLGFRYEYDGPDGHPLIIEDELTEFNFASAAQAWWIPGGEWNRYEYLYQKTPLSAVPLAHTPITMRTAEGLHISLHEAALVDYSGMWLKQVKGRRFKAELAPNPMGGKVHAVGAFKTPWRSPGKFLNRRPGC